MLQLNELRLKIRSLIKEISLINELQKIPAINDYISNFFKNVDFYLNGEYVPSEMAKRELESECASSLRLEILDLEKSNFDFQNFYIIKFSDFYLKTLQGKQKITFADPQTNKEALFTEFTTSFAVYIFNDKICRIFPYNENFQTDSVLESNAKTFISSKQFQDMFGTKTQVAKFTGEMITRTISKPIIVFSSYFSPAKKLIKKDPDSKPFIEKKSYRVNANFTHDSFGTGKIKSVKRIKNSERDGYYLMIDFPKGLKKIFANAAA